MGAEDGPFAVPVPFANPAHWIGVRRLIGPRATPARPGLLRRRNFPYSLYSWACEHLLSTQTFFTP